MWKRQTLLPDIHRRGGIIENLLMTGKGGVSCEARGAGKVGYGNDRGVVAPTGVESKLIRPMELLLRHLPNADDPQSWRARNLHHFIPRTSGGYSG
jgi:hypothetical protein